MRATIPSLRWFNLPRWSLTVNYYVAIALALINFQSNMDIDIVEDNELVDSAIRYYFIYVRDKEKYALYSKNTRDKIES